MSPRLIYCLSTKPDERKNVPFDDKITIGRSGSSDQAMIALDLPNVSARHATITSEGILRAIGGVRYYEQWLDNDQLLALKSGDFFSIPDNSVNLDLPRYIFHFYHPKMTERMPIVLEFRIDEILVYGRRIKMGDLEMKILHYIAEPKNFGCDFDDILSNLWSDEEANLKDPDEALRWHLKNIKAKITGKKSESESKHSSGLHSPEFIKFEKRKVYFWVHDIQLHLNNYLKSY